MVRPQPQDLLAEGLAHAHPRLVHRDVVEHRIGTGEIDEFEDAGRMLARLGALPGVQLAFGGHHDALARAHVAQPLEAQQVQGH